MKIRFYNCRVLSMIADNDIFDGEVWVEGSLITYVGQSIHTDRIWDREIDLNHNLIMPGFKNAHSHSAMTGLRSFADDKPLKSWLEQSIFPIEAKLQPDDVYHLAKLANLEYLSSGITANFDMYFFPESTAKASFECGMRTVLLGALNNHCQSPQEVEMHYQQFNTAEQYNGLISYKLGFHAEYTTSLSLLEELAAIAQKYQAPVFTHISETKQEVDSCVDRYGMTPAVLFEQLGLYDYGGGGYHGVHLTEEDMDIFKAKNLSIVLNCSANLKLSSGIAPIPQLIAKDINIAIGTDGPASNNSLNMFKEMFLTAGLGKLQSNPACVTGDQVLKMATVNGAKAMGLAHSATLSENSLADLIVIDMHKPNMQPINHIINNLVYSGSKDNIKLTMINGEILYEDGQYTRINRDEEYAIYRKANEIIKRLSR